MEKVPITAGGFAALEVELKHRQQVERQRIIEAISEARALGDLSENAEYHAAKEAQSLNEGRIMELESLIGRADIIDVSKLGGDTIKFGATVTLIDDDTEEEKLYQIVGEPESDVKSGKVSIGSPIIW
jgi:transcription elongation factor GreA